MTSMDSVMALAGEYGLRVIEDAAQSLGAEDRGRPAGSIGACGTFSFYPSKNLGGFGESGMLVTNDDGLAEQARRLRSHGAEQKYFHQKVGANFRMDPLQAALLNVKIAHLDQYSNRRAANAACYTARLSEIGPLRDHILLPEARPGVRHIWNQYTLRIPGGRRDALKDFLASRGIGTEIYYPCPMHLQECFPPSGGVHPLLPVSEQLAAECLSIPVFPELTGEQLDFVVRAIAGFFES